MTEVAPQPAATVPARRQPTEPPSKDGHDKSRPPHSTSRKRRHGRRRLEVPTHLLATLLFGRSKVALELLFELRICALEELHLLRVLLLLQRTPLALALLDRLRLRLELLHLSLEVLLLRLELLDPCFHVRLPLLRLQCLPHAERNR